MIAEYTAVAGAPSPDTPWALVVDIYQRAGQFEARRKLTAMEAVADAVAGKLFGDDAARELQEERERLRKAAYPGVKAPDQFLPNGFAAVPEGAVDG